MPKNSNDYLKDLQESRSELEGEIQAAREDYRKHLASINYSMATAVIDETRGTIHQGFDGGTDDKLRAVENYATLAGRKGRDYHVFTKQLADVNEEIKRVETEAR